MTKTAKSARPAMEPATLHSEVGAERHEFGLFVTLELVIDGESIGRIGMSPADATLLGQRLVGMAAEVEALIELGAELDQGGDAP